MDASGPATGQGQVPGDVLRFSCRVLVFLLLQALLFGLRWDSEFPREQNFLAATIEKHNRLRSTPPPRVIFVGGSSLPFGICSDVIEKELGWPVVNLGLASAVPREFMLNEAASAVRKGDLVVLSFEYSLLCDEGRLLNLSQLLEYRPASLRFVPLHLWKRLAADHGLTMIGTVIRRSLGGVSGTEGGAVVASTYVRRAFNSRGDYVGHYGKPDNLSTLPLDSPVLRPPKLRPLSSKAREDLERFARYCRRQGACCVFACPPHPIEVLGPQLDLIEGMVASLRSIPGLIVLDGPRDQVYERALFYDTPYHLTEAGVSLRTTYLIGMLRPLQGIRRREMRGATERGPPPGADKGRNS